MLGRESLLRPSRPMLLWNRPGRRVTEQRVTPIPPERQFFAERMLELRRKRSLTQVQLAARSGVTQAHVSALERGAWEPRLETIVAIARALKVQPSALMPKIDLKSTD